MTKADFRHLVLHGMESLMTLPDNLWECTLPAISISVRDRNGVRLRVIVGVEEVEDHGSDSNED
jgi:hypothetical protein